MIHLVVGFMNFISFIGELEKQDWILIIHMNWFVVCGDF
jgi:hypothetical protein